MKDGRQVMRNRGCCLVLGGNVKLCGSGIEAAFVDVVSLEAVCGRSDVAARSVPRVPALCQQYPLESTEDM